MKTFRLIGLSLIALPLASQVQASITSYSENGSAFTAQADSNSSIFNHYYGSAGPFTFSDPSITTTDGDSAINTKLDFTAGLTQSATYLEMDGAFAGNASCYWNNPTGVNNAIAQAYDQVNFTVDTTALVTLTAYNTVANISGFSTSFCEINFNGAYYQLSIGDTTSSFTVGPGSYYMWYDVSCDVYAGPGYGTNSSADISTNYKLTVETTPEPTTLSLLGLGVAALLRRRSKRG